MHRVRASLFKPINALCCTDTTKNDSIFLAIFFQTKKIFYLEFYFWQEKLSNFSFDSILILLVHINESWLYLLMMICRRKTSWNRFNSIQYSRSLWCLPPGMVSGVQHLFRSDLIHCFLDPLKKRRISSQSLDQRPFQHGSSIPIADLFWIWLRENSFAMQLPHWQMSNSELVRKDQFIQRLSLIRWFDLIAGKSAIYCLLFVSIFLICSLYRETGICNSLK